MAAIYSHRLPSSTSGMRSVESPPARSRKKEARAGRVSAIMRADRSRSVKPLSFRKKPYHRETPYRRDFPPERRNSKPKTTMTDRNVHDIISKARERNARWLNLSNLDLEELPTEIGQLTELRVLWLAGNNLTRLPAEIGNLRKLKRLRLEGNALAELPPEIGLLTKLEELQLHKNQLPRLPQEFWRLVNLKKLTLAGNLLEELPGEIGRLKALEDLRLGGYWEKVGSERDWFDGNQIRRLSPEIAQLSALQYLSVSNNQLTAIPPEIAQLKNLQELDVSGNEKLKFPPEIIEAGTEAILDFLRKQPEPQWVSKMLVVGEGEVGKTSLLRALRGEEFVKGLKTTHGIETDKLCFAHPDRPEIEMQLNTWDFGGQQIYHATHQFFLTNRSLYALVWNARMGFEQCKLYYWLDMIAARAPQSPILIVATYLDERRPGLPFAEIRQSYLNVVDEHFEISNETGEGIERLREAIAKEAAELPLMGEPWPPDWTRVKEALRKKAVRSKYITPVELEKVMSKHNVTGFESRVLTRFLHELGEIIYFGERDELKDTVILKSQWATQAISKVLESEEVQKGLGLFKREHMEKVWRAIEPGMRDYMLNLMEQFDLSYRTLNDRDISIVVERLAYDPPPECQEKWNSVPQPYREISMRFVLDKTMPAGVPTWFIARQHRFATNTHWRYGALFADHEQRHWELIEAYPHDRFLRLTVRGPAPQDFFALLRDGLELTLRRFEGLEVTRLVPCPGHDEKPCDHEFDYEHLKKRIERTPPKNEIECPQGEDNVFVPRMLYGLHADTTYQMLSRKLDEGFAGVDGKLEEALGDLRYLQRDLTNHYNALQRAEEASCPYLFVLRGGTFDSDLIGLFGPTGSHGMIDSLRETVWKRRVELQLYCQQPGCWHPVGYERGKDDPATGLYQIEVGSDFLKMAAPHLARVAKLFKLAQPLLGAWVSWAEPEKYAKQFKEDLERMKKFADQIGPAVEDSHEAKRTGALGDGRDPREANGAMLRALKRLLEEKDKTGAWGGLTRKLTKEGHYLWLCPSHAEEYLD